MPELTGARSQDERIAALVAMVGGPVRAAALIGKTRTHVDNMRKPNAPLRLEDVLALTRAAGVPLDWVVSGASPPATHGTLDDAAAGGFGALPGFLRLQPLRPDIVVQGGRSIERWTPSEIAVSPQWLDSAFGLSSDTARYALAGDGGMAPLIGKGASVIVDVRPGKPRTGLYLVGVGEELLARRLNRLPGGAAELVADADPRWRYAMTAEAELELYPILWVGQKV